MKLSKLLIQILLVLIVTVKCGFSQQNKMTIQIGSADKQISFAGEEIKKAAENKGYSVILGKTLNAKSKDEMIVKVISDSVLSVKICLTDNLKMPPKFGWQCYSIRVKETGSQKVIYVLSGDKTGAMYGGFDIAEAIRPGTIALISDSDNKPYLERRGIKFNIPLDLRTPSYSDMGDAAQQNIPVVWEIDFWKQQFDEMARNRYNVISLWSENSFPSLVKIPEFPEIALDDIEAFAAIGNYYAEKIRGASSLALYNYYGLKQDQDDAIQHLTNARSFWVRYASIYDTQYKPSLLTRIGFVNIPELIEKTDQDIKIATDWLKNKHRHVIPGASEESPSTILKF